jgi:hypothetical protein
LSGTNGIAYLATVTREEKFYMIWCCSCHGIFIFSRPTIL